MTTADNMVPVLCTLARHHGGDHDEHGVPAKRPCGEVVRYVEREPAEDIGWVDESRKRDDDTPPLTIGATYACDHCNVEGPAAGENTWQHPDVDRCTDSGKSLGRGYVHAPPPTSPAPVPADPPALADLIADLTARTEDVLLRENEEGAAHLLTVAAKARVSVAISTVAKHIGKGALVDIGGKLFRSVAPRKKGGGGGDGLWRLEPVEVKR